MGRPTVYSLLVVTGLLFLLAGCDSGGNLAAAGDIAAPAPQANGSERLAVKSAGSGQPTHCQITGTVKSGERPLKLDVGLQAEAGVLFTPTGTSQATLEAITLAPNESREFLVPCYLDTARAWLPGAYVVQVTVTHEGGSNIYEEGRTNLYVQADHEGRPRIFASADEYDLIYNKGYVPGDHGLDYRIELADGPFPNSGILYLKVTETIDRFAPAIDVKSVGAFQFDHYGHPAHVPVSLLSNSGVEIVLDEMWAGGARIVGLPFRLKEGCMAGTYKLEVVKLNGAGGTALVAEQAPLTLEVAVDPASPGDPWVERLITGKAQPTAPTPPLGPVLNKWQQQGVVQGEGAPPTAATGGASRPILSAGGALPDSAAMPNAAPRAPGWYAPAGLRGSLWDVYQVEYTARGGTMRWLAFREAVLQQNPHLLADDNLFYPDKEYWLPPLW